MTQEKQSFWSSAPGTVAAVAAMVTALAGIVPIVMAVKGGDNKPAGAGASPTPSASVTDSPYGSSPAPGSDGGNGDEPFAGAPDNGAAPPVIASPKSIDFGRVAAALSSPTQGLQLVNSGQNPVTIDRMRIIGPAASAFTISDASCKEGDELAPDATCDLKIRFAPSGSGPQQATLVVDRSPGNPIQVALSATVGLL